MSILYTKQIFYSLGNFLKAFYSLNIVRNSRDCLVSKMVCRRTDWNWFHSYKKEKEKKCWSEDLGHLRQLRKWQNDQSQALSLIVDVRKHIKNIQMQYGRKPWRRSTLWLNNLFLVYFHLLVQVKVKGIK